MPSLAKRNHLIDWFNYYLIYIRRRSLYPNALSFRSNSSTQHRTPPLGLRTVCSRNKLNFPFRFLFNFWFFPIFADQIFNFVSSTPFYGISIADWRHFSWPLPTNTRNSRSQSPGKLAVLQLRSCCILAEFSELFIAFQLQFFSSYSAKMNFLI